MTEETQAVPIQSRIEKFHAEVADDGCCSEISIEGPRGCQRQALVSVGMHTFFTVKFFSFVVDFGISFGEGQLSAANSESLLPRRLARGVPTLLY